MNDGNLMQLILVAIGTGTPLLFASVGEIVAERTGVMNLGIEGMMLVGAVVGYWAAVSTGNAWIGAIAGILGGAAMSAIHGVVSISMRGNQIVSGVALVILGTGLSEYLGSAGDPPLAERALPGGFDPVLDSGLADLPIVGPILFGQDPLVYLSWALVIAASFYLFHTRWGLAARSVGENPASADASGFAVNRIRYGHVIFGGACAGLAGAYLSLALFNTWQAGLSAGSGWIAFALVIFASWRPWRALVAAYVFGALTGVGFNLQLLDLAVPLDLLAALPFVMALIVLVLVSNLRSARRLGAPAALAEPYWRESR